MTFGSFIVKFLSVVACALFGAGFAASTAKAFKDNEFGEFGMSLMLTIGFVTGLIKVVCM